MIRTSPSPYVSDLEKIGFFETVVQEIETADIIEAVVELKMAIRVIIH